MSTYLSSVEYLVDALGALVRSGRLRLCILHSWAKGSFIDHPEGNPWANLQSISHKCFLQKVAFEWESTEKNYLFAPGLSPGWIREHDHLKPARTMRRRQGANSP